MKAIDLQRACIVVAAVNFTAMLFYLLGSRWSTIFILGMIACDALIAGGLLVAAHRQVNSDEPRTYSGWLHPNVMLNAVVVYALGVLGVLILTHHFPRQGFIFLAAGIGFCFLAAKISEIVTAREIDRL
jgi:hypothetical protein